MERGAICVRALPSAGFEHKHLMIGPFMFGYWVEESVGEAATQVEY